MSSQVTHAIGVASGTDANMKLEAIMPVHLFGQAAEMDAIMEFADAHNIKVIEDAAQAIGADYNGKQIGSIAIGCFSLRFGSFLVKNENYLYIKRKK